LVVFAIASAGAASALVSQALVSRSILLTPPAQALPALAPAPSAQGAQIVVGGSNDKREIVLHIRVDTSASEAPTVTVEPDAVGPAPEASTTRGKGVDVRRGPGVSTALGRR
jgi:hypothetical protein